MIDLIVCVRIVLGTAMGIFAIFHGIYFLCCREPKEFLKPCTKEAKKHKDRVDKQDRFDYKGLKDISDNAKNRKNRKN